MNIFQLNESNSIEFQQKLFDFEKLFTYPLGDNKRFRIDHSPNYQAFYQAIGESKVIIAEKNEQIIAVISAVIRDIITNGKVKKVAYIGDLKIHPAHRSGRILYSLTSYLKTLLEQEVQLAYGVVMEGTNNTPNNYTGRLGIPFFDEVEKIHILRFVGKNYGEGQADLISKSEGYKLYKDLNKESPAVSLSDPNLRSSTPAVWFRFKDACVMIEDTRKAKRLFLTDKQELISAHLSYFSFSNPLEATILLKQSIEYIYKLSYSGVFLALSSSQKLLMDELLKQFAYDASYATIFATDKDIKNIIINTSEI